MQSSLKLKTLELVRHHLEVDRGTLLALSRNTGIEYDWLWRFANERATFNDVDRVQAIYEHLSGKALAL